jgi:hypothetical protein
MTGHCVPDMPQSQDGLISHKVANEKHRYDFLAEIHPYPAG